MRIQSLEYGSKAFVSVEEIGTSGLFSVTDRNDVTINRTGGRDATATVNGINANTDGLKLTFSSTLLKLEAILDETFGNGSTGLGSSQFAVTEGGALFQLGPQVSTNLQENIGVKSMQANKLGNSIVGFLSELKSGQSNSLNSGNFQQASKIVQEVTTQVAVLRGRLGAFERNTLQPNIRQLQITTENLTSSESVIMFKIQRYHVLEDAIWIYWADFENRTVVTEFGGFTNNRRNMEQVRGRYESDGEWKYYNRSFVSC